MKAYLDGKLVSQQTTDYRQMGTTSGPMPKNPAALGLRCRNQALFTAIDLLEVTGKAKLLRDGP